MRDQKVLREHTHTPGPTELDVKSPSGLHRDTTSPRTRMQDSAIAGACSESPKH